MAEEPPFATRNAAAAQPPPLSPMERGATASTGAVSLPRLAILLTVVVLGISGLHFFPPGRSGFYPPCIFHRVTGLDCPGCGATRAVYSLLHGQFALAWHQNAILVLLAPAGLFGSAVAGWRWIHRRPLPSLPWQPWSIFLLLATLAIFGVARNVGR